MILYKQVYRELLRAMHPSAIWPVRIRGAVVSQNVLSGVMAFGFIWMGLFLIGALIVYRIGTFIPVPGVNPAALATLKNDEVRTALTEVPGIGPWTATSL